MAMLYKTKGNANPRQKPRVYFTCHPDDFEYCFKKISDDIFKTHDCAIYYTENMSEPLSSTDRTLTLEYCQLFVIPITKNLLTTPNRAMDHDIPFALEKNIHILPIMMNLELKSAYKDRFGMMQYLTPFSNDPTEIPYEEKLKNHLESVLVSNALAERIRSAFDAYIFLSYRKMDRHYANELMQLIHRYPECRDIAIWFDEFLTPGISFEKNIDEILHNSKLFALLVTPNLLEESNFVMENEYPAACEAGIEILPAEMEATDKEKLNLSFKNLPSCVDPHDQDLFKARLLGTLSKLAITSNDTPEHNFLIGLAYLKGIDVEVNRKRGLELLLSAARQNLPEAMEKLIEMYINGIDVERDYRKATEWAERLVEQRLKTDGAKSELTLEAQQKLGFLYSSLGELDAASELHRSMYETCCAILGKTNVLTLETQNNLASNYYQKGMYKSAAKLYREFLDICDPVFEDTSSTKISAMNNLAICYHALNNLDGAIELLEKVCTLCLDQLGEENEKTLNSFSSLAAVYAHKGDFDTALEKIEKAYRIACTIYGKISPDSFAIINNMASICQLVGNRQKAIEILQEAYDSRLLIFGKEVPETLTLARNLIQMYSTNGDLEDALKLANKTDASMREILHEDHPDIACMRRIIMELQYKTGNPELAAKNGEELLKYELKTRDEKNDHTATIMNNLAFIYMTLNNYERAMELAQKAYDIRHEILGVTHPDTLATGKILTTIYVMLGHHEEGEKLSEELYQAFCVIRGKDHPDTLLTLNDNAFFLYKNQKYDCSLEKALLAYEKLCRKSENERTLRPLQNIFHCYRHLENYEQAAQWGEKLLVSYVLQHGVNHPEIPSLLQELNDLYSKVDGHTALELITAAYELRSQTFGKKHVFTRDTAINAALKYKKQGDERQVQKWIKEAICINIELYGDKNPDTISLQKYLASSYKAAEDFASALKLYTQIYESEVKLYGNEHKIIISTLSTLSALHSKQKNFETALELAQQAYSMAFRLLGEKNPKTGRRAVDLAFCYYDLGNLSKTLEWFQTAYTLRCRSLGEDHPDTLRLLGELSVSYEHLGDLENALKTITDLYTARSRLLGKDHPDTQKALSRMEQLKKQTE